MPPWNRLSGPSSSMLVAALLRRRDDGQQAQELQRAEQVPVRAGVARADARGDVGRAQQDRLRLGELEPGGQQRGRAAREREQALARRAVGVEARLDRGGGRARARAPPPPAAASRSNGALGDAARRAAAARRKISRRSAAAASPSGSSKLQPSCTSFTTAAVSRRSARRPRRAVARLVQRVVERCRGRADVRARDVRERRRQRRDARAARRRRRRSGAARRRAGARVTRSAVSTVVAPPRAGEGLRRVAP